MVYRNPSPPRQQGPHLHLRVRVSLAEMLPQGDKKCDAAAVKQWVLNTLLNPRWPAVDEIGVHAVVAVEVDKKPRAEREVVADLLGLPRDEVHNILNIEGVERYRRLAELYFSCSADVELERRWQLMRMFCSQLGR